MMVFDFSRLFAQSPRPYADAARVFGGGADPLEWMKDAGVAAGTKEAPPSAKRFGKAAHEPNPHIAHRPTRGAADAA